MKYFKKKKTYLELFISLIFFVEAPSVICTQEINMYRKSVILDRESFFLTINMVHLYG